MSANLEELLRTTAGIMKNTVLAEGKRRIRPGAICTAAADRITELEAENARLREQLNASYYTAGKMAEELMERDDRAEQAEAKLAEVTAAWEAARKTLPHDPNLNQPWSQAIAIMDESVGGLREDG